MDFDAAGFLEVRLFFVLRQVTGRQQHGERWGQRDGQQCDAAVVGVDAPVRRSHLQDNIYVALVRRHAGNVELRRMDLVAIFCLDDCGGILSTQLDFDCRAIAAVEMQCQTVAVQPSGREIEIARGATHAFDFCQVGGCRDRGYRQSD